VGLPAHLARSPCPLPLGQRIWCTRRARRLAGSAEGSPSLLVVTSLAWRGVSTASSRPSGWAPAAPLEPSASGGLAELRPLRQLSPWRRRRTSSRPLPAEIQTAGRPGYARPRPSLPGRQRRGPQLPGPSPRPRRRPSGQWPKGEGRSADVRRGQLPPPDGELGGGHPCWRKGARVVCAASRGSDRRERSAGPAGTLPLRVLLNLSKVFRSASLIQRPSLSFLYPLHVHQPSLNGLLALAPGRRPVAFAMPGWSPTCGFVMPISWYEVFT